MGWSLNPHRGRGSFVCHGARHTPPPPHVGVMLLSCSFPLHSPVLMGQNGCTDRRGQHLWINKQCKSVYICRWICRSEESACFCCAVAVLCFSSPRRSWMCHFFPFHFYFPPSPRRCNKKRFLVKAQRHFHLFEVVYTLNCVVSPITRGKTTTTSV